MTIPQSAEPAAGPVARPPEHNRAATAIAAGARRNRGALLVLFSALCFAALGILAQLAYRVSVPAGTLASGRFLLATAVFWSLVLYRRRPLPSRRDAIGALALGLVYSSSTELLFASLTQTKAALVDLLFFSYPALVVLGSLVWRKEHPDGRRASSVCMSLFGTALVVGGGANELHVAGASLAFGAAALYAIYVLCASDLLARVDALVLVALVTAGAAGGATVAGLGLGQLRLPHGAEPLLLVAGVAFVSSVLGIGSFIAGVARVGPAHASVVSSVEPALTAVLAFLAFGDRLGPIQLGGGALVIAAIGVLERRPRQTSSAAPRKAGACIEHRSLPDAVVVRLAGLGDRPALERLAALDSKQVPPGALVVADVGGMIVAATAVEAPADALGDPFRPTGYLVELLELRAAQIRQAHRQHETRLVPRLAAP
jgi:drug/metabolite transporter (DMT)-like permease